VTDSLENVGASTSKEGEYEFHTVHKPKLVAHYITHMNAVDLIKRLPVTSSTEEYKGAIFCGIL
jgi:hypothetical protein